MVGLDAKGLQAFLYVNADSAAAAPQANNEIRAKAAFENLHAEPEGVFDKLVLVQEAAIARALLGCVCLGHGLPGYSVWCDHCVLW